MLGCLFLGCDRKPSYSKRYWSVGRFADGHGFVGLYSHPEGEFVYGFFYSGAVEVTVSGAEGFAPKPSGVSFTSGQRDGLWIDGKRVAVTGERVVLVIKADKSVVPLDLDEGEAREVAEADSGILTTSLWKTKIAPAFKSSQPQRPAEGGASQ
jgi:hypothetical protein